MKSTLFIVFILTSTFGFSQVDSLDTPPEFPGGMEEMYGYLSEHLTILYDSDGNPINGSVVVSFVIDSIGSVTNPTIVKTSDDRLNQGVLNLISNMPDWKPGIEKGIPANIKYTLPLNFGNTTSSFSTTTNDDKGLSYLKDGDYKTAAKYYKLAYKGEPTNPDHMFNLALCYSKMGKTGKACTFWKRAAKYGDDEAQKLLEEKCAD